MADQTNDSTGTVSEIVTVLDEALDGFIQLLGGPEQAAMLLVALGAAGLGGALGFILRGNKKSNGESEKDRTPDLLPPPKTPEEEIRSGTIIGYRQHLEEAGVPDSEREALVRVFAHSLGRLENLLENLDPSDDTHHAIILEAKGALATGDLAGCIEQVNKAAEREYAGGREMARIARDRMLYASRNKAVAGDLAATRQDFSGAAEFYAEAASAMPDGNDVELAEILNKHGGAAYSTGDLDAAVKSYKRAVKLLQSRPDGAENPDLAALFSNLAMLQYERGDYDGAEPLYLKALEIDERGLGSEHPIVAKDLNNLALLYKMQGNYKDAVPLMKRSISIKEKLLDPSDPSLVTGLMNYSALLKALIAEDQQAAAGAGNGDTESQKRAEKRKEKRSEAARQMEAAARALAAKNQRFKQTPRPKGPGAQRPPAASTEPEQKPEKGPENGSEQGPKPEPVADAAARKTGGPKLSVSARPARRRAVEN